MDGHLPVTPPTPLLEIVGAELSFGGVRALQGIDLAVAHGESAALIGPNGSGKSTLVNVITRMVDVDRGAVLVDGVDVTRVRRHELVGFGIARSFQHVRLIPELTLRENTEVGIAHHDLKRRLGELRTWFGFRSRRQAAAIVDQTLDLLDVPHDARDHLPSQVPFVLQRLTEIARALVTEPRLLLLDEPVAGMNPGEVLEFAKTLRKINVSGCAVLLIEHNIDFVMTVADNITVINRGVRIAHGTAEHVRRDPDVIEAYLGIRHGDDSAGGAR